MSSKIVSTKRKKKKEEPAEEVEQVEEEQQPTEEETRASYGSSEIPSIRTKSGSTLWSYRRQDGYRHYLCFPYPERVRQGTVYGRR
ncbi:MAG: hypothetical protein ACYTDW_18315 [Planctomycetota bacterium]